VVGAHDGVEAFNEATRLALANGVPGRVDIVIQDGPQVVAMAYAAGHAPVELAVHPAHRRRGHATALLDRLTRVGETRFWAHGDTAGARGLAADQGLTRGRVLLRLSRPPGPLPRQHGPHPEAGMVIRPFRPHDLAGLLAVNARAFRDHPEQGGMDRADFARRAGSDWFDPGGIFVAEKDGTIVGFHWTKVDTESVGRRAGEVYVLAVDPDHVGRHLGSALLRRGLEHLTASGIEDIDLYTEADNRRASALYEAVGFIEAGRDVLYVSRKPASTDRGPS
jgi:mycothiol synthase